MTYHFMAAVIFFNFVCIDERPAMGSQPNLASRSEVVSIYKCPQKFLGLPPNLGHKKTSNFLPICSRLSHSTLHISGRGRTKKSSGGMTPRHRKRRDFDAMYYMGVHNHSGGKSPIFPFSPGNLSTDLLSEMSHRQTKMLVSVYNLFPKS